MGNRGKGSKGKLTKKGKGGKGRKGGGGASKKWGDESAGRGEDEGQKMKKKRRLTQETQDRQRRIKMMELSRAKERAHSERLSQPNRELIEAIAAKPPNPNKRKRQRNKRLARSEGGSDIYYSSSDDEQRMGGGANGGTREAKGVFDAGLASYKKLLTALEMGSSKVLTSGIEDKDLAAAVVARRMQREGRDGHGSDSQSGSDAEGDDEAEEEAGEAGEGDDEQQEANKRQNRLKSTSNGKHTLDQENANIDFSAPATEDDLDGIEEDLARESERADRRRRDEFCRHFVSTPVFPADVAAGLLSASRRPSFKPVSTAARSEWKAVGLSASVSRMTDIPPALPQRADLYRDLGILPSLAEGWDKGNDGTASKLQSLILPSLAGYRDMLYCGWRDEDADAIRRSYVLHALNHALTSQRRVARHTVRLRKVAEETKVAKTLAKTKDGTDATGAEASNGSDGTASRRQRGAKGTATPAVAQADKQDQGGDTSLTGKAIDAESDEWERDQGFTRPKVLILLPFRGLAHEVVMIMIALLGPKTVVINRDRFDEEFGPDDETNIEGTEEDGTADGDARAKRAKTVLERKPGDWKALFGEGRNVDDMFTFGLSLSPGGGKGKPGEGKGVGVRLCCDFYNSDIIFASPVALHRASVPGGDDVGARDGDIDSDFLSSVEVCILDRADVFLMQNWAYVPDIAEVLNSRPTGERAARTDFSRVRPLFLHDQGRLFRQMLVFSAYQDPNLNALVSKQFRNHDGIVKICRPSGDGHICEVALQAKQVFQRVPCGSPVSQDDARFEYFVGTVLPQLVRAKQAHTAVFIPSYFDYVRVRNHLMKTRVSVVNVHEYSRGSEVARSRARFFRGDRDLLLYTGRAHFFNRYCIRGIHHLIFYSLPECPQFYPEMVNLLEEAESVASVTCLSLFTRFERLSLERIVGEERAAHMLGSTKNTFLFC